MTVGAYTTVEADTLEDAIKEAERRPAQIGGSRSGYSEEEFWIVEEADGEPQNISLRD